MKLLFESHNRRGVGHLMRGINIAKEIRLQDPAAEIVFFLKNDSTNAFQDHEFQYVVGEKLFYGHELAKTFSPDAIIYDTLIPNQPVDRRTVYIMRKCKPEKQREIFQHPFLKHVNLILIPHLRYEWDELPNAIQEKSFYVGPIVRRLNPETQAALRTKYRINDGDFVLISTAGGGGFESAASFFKTTHELHKRLQNSIENLKHIVVLGPNFENKLDGIPGMSVISVEPELSNLFALSDLVIAEAGYNTVQEIRAAKVPSVLLPAFRNYDDQEERARDLEKRGLCFVFTDRFVHGMLDEMVNICTSRSTLQQIRMKYQDDVMRIGNRFAAEKIIRLVSS